MILVTLFFILLFNSILTQENKSEKEEDEEFLDRWVKSQVSVGTYYSLKNISTEYKLNYRLLEEVEARTRRQYYDINADFSEIQAKHPSVENTAVIGCKMVDKTYRSALKELRRYFPVRTLYYDNLEFEAGYLVYQIVYKYKVLIEIFHIAYRRYALQNDTQIAPTVYMFYLYRKMADTGRTIVHLCNMLNEIRKKYRGHKSVFYVKRQGERDPLFDSSDEDKADKDLFYYKQWQQQHGKKKKKKKNKAKCAKKKKKLKEDDLCKAEYLESKVFDVSRKPTRRPWFPLVYGWSNEELLEGVDLPGPPSWFNMFGKK